MSLRIFGRNSIEASVRYIPIFGWLLTLPYSDDLDLSTLIKYLSAASFFLLLTNISFDRSLLYAAQKGPILQRNILTLQALRTALVTVFLVFYGFFIYVTDDSPFTFEFLLVAALTCAQSLEVGDWFLRAITHERRLLQVKTWIVALLGLPLVGCAVFGYWYAFHMIYVLTILLFGTLPYLVYRLSGKWVSDQDVSATEGFWTFLLQLSRMGKDFFFAAAPNLFLRRTSPWLFVQSGYSDDIIYAFFMLMRLLDAMTPMFVAGTNYLYRRWHSLAVRQCIKDYVLIQTALLAILAGFYAAYATWVEIVLPEYWFVLHTFFWVYVFVTLLNQRNALFLALEMTRMLPRFNLLALVPLPFLLTIGPQVEYMRNGTLLYVSFLATSFILTHLFVLRKWRQSP